MYALIPSALVLWLVAPAESADIPGAANRAEHAALCKFIAMASGEVEVPTIPALPTDEYNYIHMVNYSTAPESWRDVFFKDKAAKTLHDTPQAANKDKRGFESNWNRWKATALAYLDLKTEDQKKQNGVVILTPAEAALAKPQLAHLAKLADELTTELSGLQPGPSEPTTASAKQALAQATYGQDSIPSPDPAPAKVFSAAPTGNRETLCEAKDSGAQVATALAALACVCTKGSGNAVAPAVCTAKAEGTTAWEGATGTSSATGGAALTAVAKSCPPGKHKVTHAEIKEAIEDLDKLIHKGDTDAYLGAFVNSNCDGSSGNGVCIKFSDYAKKKAPLVNELTWIPPLKDLLNKLASLETKKQRAEQLVDQIKSLKKETTVVIEVAKTTASSMAKFETKTNHQKPTSETRSSCSAHNTNKTCTEENNCKWDSTTEKTGEYCKPKNGEGQKTQGTGSNCGQYKDPESCKKAPGDKKRVKMLSAAELISWRDKAK
uniref:Variant surface glycoprotein 1058 n=1 Tax=Trypanosoma brucei TaxID=5691 RepID=M4SVF0_9TRYP|nr:variant surface glycoprotein 1058 [Trypanosoma brucei]